MCLLSQQSSFNLAHAIEELCNPCGAEIINKFTLRRASGSIVEHLCKRSRGSFLLVHVLGDVSALAVSPLKKTKHESL